MSDTTESISAILSREEGVLNSAKAKALAEHAYKPSPDTQRALSAANKALVDLAKRQAYADTDSLPNISKAYQWLMDRYDIKLGYRSFALHCRNGYRCIGDPSNTTYRIPSKRGLYASGDIELYARNRGYKLKNSDSNATVERDHPPGLKEARDRINIATARIQEAKAGEIEGRLIRRHEIEAKNAKAASFLKIDLSNYGPYICDRFIGSVSDYLKSHGIDIDSVNLTAIVPDLITDYDIRLDQWLDRYTEHVE